MPALIADIGGTHARFEITDGQRAVRSATLASPSYPSAEDAIDAFLKPEEKPSAMVLAVAGPVDEGRWRATNLSWHLDERTLTQRYGIPARLLNDFAAVAYGIDTLGPSDLRELQPGRRDAEGTVAILGAGTGLGEALLVRNGGQTKVISTEGGHTDFGPWDERSDRVLVRLREKYGRVSIERVASGLGLADLFEIVCSEGWAEALPSTLAAAAEDAGKAVGNAVDDPAAQLTLALFARALGAETGNLALKSLPAGGIRIAGGVVPKLLETWGERFTGPFLEGYLNKGRMKTVLERFAIDVVLATDVGLRGARSVAAAMT